MNELPLSASVWMNLRNIMLSQKKALMCTVLYINVKCHTYKTKQADMNMAKLQGILVIRLRIVGEISVVLMMIYSLNCVVGTWVFYYSLAICIFYVNSYMYVIS